MVEVLTVLLLVGILTCTGTAFYVGLAQETNERTQISSLQAFIAACRGRARLRGIPVELRLVQSTLSAIDAPALSMGLSSRLSGQLCKQLGGLVFSASATLLAGKPVHRLLVTFEGSNASAVLTLDE
ncbi:MAG: hypothetical protein HQM09_00220 [Candidatus Riflebacteria bacterium]|nr:hypothetical protein [Candidatus Riflebacteria bacterium]